MEYYLCNEDTVGYLPKEFEKSKPFKGTPNENFYIVKIDFFKMAHIYMQKMEPDPKYWFKQCIFTPRLDVSEILLNNIRTKGYIPEITRIFKDYSEQSLANIIENLRRLYNYDNPIDFVNEKLIKTE